MLGAKIIDSVCIRGNCTVRVTAVAVKNVPDDCMVAVISVNIICRNGKKC